MPYGRRSCGQITASKAQTARFHADLQSDRADMVIRKGYNPAIDSYSALFENDRTTPRASKAICGRGALRS